LQRFKVAKKQRLESELPPALAGGS